jgi:LmbE family N-acetylglucosaminyl deacetylase
VRSIPDVEVDWLVLAAPGRRGAEARASADAFLDGAAKARVEVHGFRDGFLPYLGGEVKDVFEELKSRVDPQVIFTHAGYDFHQDHRLACELTWNTFRNHLILEYEVPKYDGDMGQPNLYVAIDDEIRRRKVEHLTQYFETQASKHWFTEELFTGLLRLRGMECNSPTAYAEAFYSRKAVLA